ncbi:MAG: MFS transporter, partial [Deltaproteobacteria bacterium]|nr:MFS transporter [Deltaproteobacteria bacterium]
MNNEYKIILFTSIAHFFSHVYELTFPALAIPLMLSLNVSLSEVLKLSFLMYLLLGLCALPWGMVADRYGSRKILTVFFIGSGLGAILTALSDTGHSITFALAVIGLPGGMAGVVEAHQVLEPDPGVVQPAEAVAPGRDRLALLVHRRALGLPVAISVPAGLLIVI